MKTNFYYNLMFKMIFVLALGAFGNSLSAAKPTTLILTFKKPIACIKVAKLFRKEPLRINCDDPENAITSEIHSGTYFGLGDIKKFIEHASKLPEIQSIQRSK